MESMGLHTTQVSENTRVKQEKPNVSEIEESHQIQPFEYVCVKMEQPEDNYEVEQNTYEVGAFEFNDSEEHRPQHIKEEEALHSEDGDSVHERLPSPVADNCSVPVEGAALCTETPAYLAEDWNYMSVPEESECDGNQLWNNNYSDSDSDSACPKLRLAQIKKRHSRVGKKSYPCSECGKSYPKLCLLKYHMRKHMDERPYSCSICGKSFAKTAHLNVHNRTHAGEKPYKCDICGKLFSDSGKRKSHMYSHNGEKPFVCDICGKSYTVRRSLQSHKGWHTSLTSHTGGNAEKCDICNKTFPCPSILEMHMRTHTGEKPYQCGVCGRGFTQLGNLKRHLQSHILGKRLRSVMVSTAE